MRNVVILGMHRSGTSMVAGALAAGGVFVGNAGDLLSDQDDNPLGFWERSDVVSLNDSILAASDSAWFNPPADVLPASPDDKDNIESILSGMPADRSWLVKDPRMVLTWPLWQSALADPLLVFVYRDPCTVAMSLQRRNGFPLSLGLALWEYYNQLVLDALQVPDSVAISYESITRDPEATLGGLLHSLKEQGVSCAQTPNTQAFDASLGKAGRANRETAEALLTDSQRQLAAYCEALCEDEVLPLRPKFDRGLLAYIRDISGALAPLATVVETQNELEETLLLCEERTGERDQSLAQLVGVEGEHKALAEAHQGEIAQHRELEQQHKGLMGLHSDLSDAYGEKEKEYGQQVQMYRELEQEHEVLTNKAEYLFTELTGTYFKLLDFEQSFLASIWRFVARAYRFLTRRRGVHSSYDDALADAHVHFDRYELEVPDKANEEGQAEQPQGKLSLFGDVLKYVARNPAGSARSFSLSRLKRATAVFIKSNPDDLDVWINSRFPDKEGVGSADSPIDPKNLDEALDQLELIFPTVSSAGQIQVSIIVPVYNDYRMTMYCLQQLLENTSDVIYEIIIGDDCSNDLTASITERVSNITVVRAEKNLGFLRNCNAAAAVARGEHVLFLNNDTGVCSNWLGPLVEILEGDPVVGIVGPKLLFGDGKLQEAGGIVWRDGSAWNFGRADDPEKPEYNYVREVDYISGACLLVRGELWQQLGGFDKRYIPAYYEDTDIAFEARAAGYKVVYQPLSQIFHFEGVSNGTDLDSGIKQYQVQNLQKFLDKWEKELQANHFPNAENVFHARGRTREKRSVLFIDHYVPHYDKDAGSRSTFMYVQLMLEMGYKVLFLGANYFPHKPYTQVLQQMGVEVLVGESMARNQDRWLKENAPYIDRIYLHRPHIAEQLLGSLEKMNPKPPIIFFGHDLHYLRIGREQKLMQDDALAKSAQKWRKREYAVFDRVDKIYYPSQVEIDEIVGQRPDLNVRAIPLYVLDDVSGFDSRE